MKNIFKNKLFIVLLILAVASIIILAGGISVDSKEVKWKEGVTQNFSLKDSDGNKYVMQIKNGLVIGLDKEDILWWDESWNQKKAVYGKFASGSDSDSYQLKLNVTYNGNMNADFSDLRFTNVAEVTELSYWIEGKSDANWALVWVKLEDPINTTYQTVAYMYYGNTGASSVSNGFTTFDFFDDFSSANATKWYAQAGSLSVSEGEAIVNQDNLIGDESFSYNHIFESRTKRVSGNSGGMHLWNESDSVDTGEYIGLSPYGVYGANVVFSVSNDDSAISDYWGEAYPTVYAVMGAALVNSTSAKSYKNYVEKLELTSNLPDTPIYPDMRQWGGAAGDNYHDWYRVREFVDTTVTTSLGAEESQ